MKINDNGRIGSVNPYKKTNESYSSSSAGKKDKPKDQVEISSEAKELLGAQATTRTEEQIKRLEELRDSVSSGTYQVDANKVAKKLLPYIK
jgi:negative regulator of flagellin synthesis FlgM